MCGVVCAGGVGGDEMGNNIFGVQDAMTHKRSIAGCNDAHTLPLSASAGGVGGDVEAIVYLVYGMQRRTENGSWAGQTPSSLSLPP